MSTVCGGFAQGRPVKDNPARTSRRLDRAGYLAFPFQILLCTKVKASRIAMLNRETIFSASEEVCRQADIRPCQEHLRLFSPTAEREG